MTLRFAADNGAAGKPRPTYRFVERGFPDTVRLPL